MATWRGTMRSAALSGAVAGLLSAATTQAANRKLEHFGAWRSLHGSRDASGRNPSRKARAAHRSPLPSILVQQLSSILWTTIHERTIGRIVGRRAIPLRLLGGAVSAATAYAVDHALTPRPTLDTQPLRRKRYLKYALIGVGVTIGGILLAQKSDRAALRKVR